MIPIKMSAMMASNKIDITCKYLLTQFTWTVTTQISILQHIILKQIMQQLRMHGFYINHSIHRFSLQCRSITFPIVRVVAAFYSMNNFGRKNKSSLFRDKAHLRTTWQITADSCRVHPLCNHLQPFLQLFRVIQECKTLTLRTFHI